MALAEFVELRDSPDVVPVELQLFCSDFKKPPAGDLSPMTEYRQNRTEILYYIILEKHRKIGPRNFLQNTCQNIANPLATHATRSGSREKLYRYICTAVFF